MEFLTYHRATPYIDEIASVLGQSSSSEQGNMMKGANRLLRRLAVISPTEFVQVAKDAGFNIEDKLKLMQLV